LKGKSIVSIVRRKVGGSPNNYSREDLKIVEKMIEEAVELIGGFDNIISNASTVLVKPNLVEPPLKIMGEAVVTDLRVIEALVRILKARGVENVLVGEGRSVNLQHIKSGARQAFEKTGMGKVVRRAGGQLVYWDEEPYVEVEIPNGEIMKEARVPKSLLESDAFISVPKMKTHCQTTITIGIKSMQGIFNVEDKRQHHREDFYWKMVDILRVIKPDLTIVDGIIAGEGYGPIFPDPVEMNLIVASTDVVAVDAVCSAIMGIEPFEVVTTRLAHAEGIGIGDLNFIEVKGESINAIKRPFRRPITWNPIGFNRKIKVFAGGACRFCLAQVGAALERLSRLGFLDKVGETAILLGCNPPLPCKKYERTLVIGDCAENFADQGVFISGCPPLPSVRIANKILLLNDLDVQG